MWCQHNKLQRAGGIKDLSGAPRAAAGHGQELCADVVPSIGQLPAGDALALICA